ncbi:MAG: pitrilysin family protein [Myxococcota bacterium]|nr:pitrilysin family protein [Myxococcota bacterium]
MSGRVARVGRSCALVAWLALACTSAGKPVWERPPPPIEVGAVVPQERVHRDRLDNGLEILVLEDHALPRLEIGLVARRGAASEPLERAGAAALMSELLERGAGDMDALALARAVEELGAALSAGAGWDSASIALFGLSEDGDRLFELLADVARRPRFDPAEVSRARAERLAALERERDDPRSLVVRHLLRVLYDGHRFGLGTSGDAESVAKLDEAALREAHAALFQPTNVILFAVGDITPQRVTERARQHFGNWPGGAVPAPGAPAPAPTPPARRIVVVDRPDLGQAQLAFGHEGISRTEPTRTEDSLMNTVLGGGGFLSRLMSKVRAEEGLTYSIGSGFSLRREPGPFSVRTFTRVAETGRVVQTVLDEIDGMHTNPPSEAETRTVKTYTAGRFALGLETASDIAGALVDLDVHGLPRDSLDTYRARVRAVTAADLARAAQQRLHPDRLAIVAVGPAAELVPQLEPFGPVEVVEP